MLVVLILALFLPFQTLALNCETKGIYLECSDLSLEELAEHYTNEETLKLTNVTGLASWNSTRLTPVNTIILNDVVLNTEAFRELVKIPHLSSLEMRAIETPGLLKIVTENFPATSNLRRLKINKCATCTIDLTLPHLSEVDLSENSFPGPVKVHGDKVQFLNLSSTSYSGVFPFADLPYLQELDLSKNGQEKIAFESISALTELEKLWLNDNALTSISLASHSIKTLNLNNNNLIKIDPVDFVHLPQLTALYLAGNKISKMVFPFNANMELKFLDLSNNQLKSIEVHWFINTVQLETLKLPNNLIENLSDLKTMLNRLHHVDLSSNRLNDLNKNFFRFIPAIAYLDLSKNNLTVIDDVMVYLNSLTRLLISNNNLKINNKTFAHLLELNYLDISNNSLTNTLSVFDGCTALRHLVLNNNNITALCDKETAPSQIDYIFLKNNKIQSLRCLSKVRYLDVENNPLQCTEELKSKLIELADSVDVLVPATDVEVFNRSELELVDGEAMFQKLCPIVVSETPETPALTEMSEILPATKKSVTPVITEVVREPVEDALTYYYSDDDANDRKESENDDSEDDFMNDDAQSQRDSIFDLDSDLQFNYHVQPVNGLTAFCLFLSVALTIVLCATLGIFVYYKIRARRSGSMDSERPYKPLRNEVYKATTAGVENNQSNIAQVFSKFKNDKLDEIMVKFGFKWNNAGDVESETRMIST